MKKTICLLLVFLSVIYTHAYVPDDNETFHDKMAIHPERRQFYNFPDTTITFKGKDFQCKAIALLMKEDSSQIKIHVQGQFTENHDMAAPGVVVHQEGDYIKIPKKTGVQKGKAKYLVWCIPPIIGYNTDMYLHVKVEFNYQNVDECRIRYKLKGKKTKHPSYLFPRKYMSTDSETRN